MSPIGRIFVVVNLALAAAFLGWASSTLANAHKFRALYEGKEVELQAEKTKLTAEIDALTTARNAAKAAQDEALRDKQRLDSEKEALKLEVANLRTEEASHRASIEKISTTLDTIDERANQAMADAKAAADERLAADQARREAETAREAAMQAERNAKKAQADAMQRIADLEEELTTAQKNIQAQENLVASYQAFTGVSVNELGGAVPTVEASVVGVKSEGDMQLVHLNKGSDDQLKRGHSIWVYSGNTLKGRARIEVVNANSATAIMVDSVEGRRPAQGDRAATRL